MAFNFSPDETAMDLHFELMPKGKYPLQCLKAEERDTKSGNGAYLWLEWEVAQGEYKGRRIFEMITTVNPNQTAVDIGRQQGANLAWAVGRGAISSTMQLIGATVVGDIYVQKDKTGQYEDQNRVRSYEPASAYRAQADKSFQAPPARNAAVGDFNDDIPFGN